MKCPFCGSDETRVIDSRPADDNTSIRRRRLCDDCKKRFTTYEKVETIPLVVIKKDNSREQYDRSKIMAGVLRACHKRPVPVQQINELVDEVETEIFNLEEKDPDFRDRGTRDGQIKRFRGSRLCAVCFRLPGIQRCQYIYE